MSRFRKDYNPDILETIANLSNDEVFTPPKLANDILDMLPQEIWSDSTITFLDPAVKTGIFLREVTSRLIDGLADEIPDLQERVNHILTKQVFGIGITQLTTLMSRRTLYCSKTANGENSICTEFDNEYGNIVLPDTKHTWVTDDKCEYCRANKEEYDRGANLESHAYSFIHDDLEEVFGKMKFDVIIGNPPYQLSDGGGTGDSAVPLYNKFIEKAIALNPKYISMITPSRWMKGGKGLNSFRKSMINDKRISHITDYQDAKEIFPSINLDGGVCYFTWDETHNGKLKYTYHNLNGDVSVTRRFLKNNYSNTVFRDYKQLSIIEKTNSKDKFSEIVSFRNPFGFSSDIFNNSERYPKVVFRDKAEVGYSVIYGVKGNKGGAKRMSKYINNDSISKGLKSIGKYKIFYSRAFTLTATVPPAVIKGYPGSLCSETFLKIGDFNSETEMNNCLSYMDTKFFRALLDFNRASFIMSKGVFSLIPLQDFSKSWTDEELYKKYSLTEEEIAYIEENIDPMGEQGDDNE